MPAELRLSGPLNAHAPSVSQCTSSPFVGPSRGLLLSTASINGNVVRVLFDDGSPINFVSWRLVRSL